MLCPSTPPTIEKSNRTANKWGSRKIAAQRRCLIFASKCIGCNGFRRHHQWAAVSGVDARAYNARTWMPSFDRIRQSILHQSHHTDARRQKPGNIRDAVGKRRLGSFAITFLVVFPEFEYVIWPENPLRRGRDSSAFRSVTLCQHLTAHVIPLNQDRPAPNRQDTKTPGSGVFWNPDLLFQMIFSMSSATVNQISGCILTLSLKL